MNLLPDLPQPLPARHEPEAPASPVYTTVCLAAAILVLAARAIAFLM